MCFFRMGAYGSTPGRNCSWRGEIKAVAMSCHKCSYLEAELATAYSVSGAGNVSVP